MITTSKTEVLCLFGPTAVGKTSVLAELWRDCPRFEIISADSVQVYKGLDIGSAKPTVQERSEIPHHLIDILPPDQQFTAGDFVHLADGAVKDIRSRGRIPILSGGTAFYFINFLYGLPDTPQADPAVRERVETLVQEQGPEALDALLAQVDPVSHDRIGQRDLYRRKRALEVYWTTGRPLSEFAVPQVFRPNLEPRLFSLYRPREELYQRINDRVEAMKAQGLVEEVRSLLAAGYKPDDPGLRSIGYAQICEYLEDPTPDRLREALSLTAQETRRYAKRQLTFFSKLPGVITLEPSRAREEILKVLNPGG